MASSQDLQHRAELKRQLAAKYFSLAKLSKGSAKRRSLLYRAERYTHQADVLASKAKAR